MFLFENLEVYQKAVSFFVNVRSCLSQIPDKEIKDQLRRAALSISLNIAEGQGRNTDKEKLQFYKIARGSLFECIPLIQILFKIGLIDELTYTQLYCSSEEIGKMTNGLINSIKQRLEI